MQRKNFWEFEIILLVKVIYKIYQMLLKLYSILTLALWIVTGDEFTDFKSEMEGKVTKLANDMKQAFEKRCEGGAKPCQILSFDECRGNPPRVCHQDFPTPEGCPGGGAYMSESTTVRFPNSVDTASLSEQEREFVCISAQMEDSFKEMDTGRESRYGKAYVATQVGSFRSYPSVKQDNAGTDECADFDPRYTPWYVSSTSGPKNVILIFDTSGSMADYNRIPLSQAASKSVIDTLGNSDWIGMIRFDSDAYFVTNALTRATESAKATIKNTIDTFSALGGTNYEAAFRKTFQLLDMPASDEYGSPCSDAENIILFMTDGQPTMGILTAPELQNLINTLKGDKHITLFTYGLGSGISQTIIHPLACAFSGVMFLLQDQSTQLQETMKKYYTFVGEGITLTQPIWSEAYQDTFGMGTISTVSMPIYYTENEERYILGVAGLDVSWESLRALGKTDEELNLALSIQTECQANTLTECQIERLRERTCGVEGCDLQKPSFQICVEETSEEDIFAVVEDAEPYDQMCCLNCDYRNDQWYDPDDHACKQCSVIIPGCIECQGSLIPQCILCETSSQYYVNSMKTCTQCDYEHEQTPQWLNDEKDGCAACSIVIEGCLQCKNGELGTQCWACDVSAYFLNTEKRCQKCQNIEGWIKLPEVGCALCSSVIDGCLTCQMGEEFPECTECEVDEVNNAHWLKLDKTACVICYQAIPGCLECSNGEQGTQCLHCDKSNQYYRNSDNICERCNYDSEEISEQTWLNLENDACVSCGEAITGCIQCRVGEDGTECVDCDDDGQYYLSGVVCQRCNINTYWLNEAGTACVPCSHFIQCCEECDPTLEIPQCSKCRDGLWLNSQQDTCEECGILIPNCLTCSSVELSTRCLFCDPAMQMRVVESTCQQCPQEQWLNLENNGCVSCNQVITGCTKCYAGVDGTACQTCSAANQYYMIDGTCLQCDNERNEWLSWDRVGCVSCQNLITGCVRCKKTEVSAECEICHEDLEYYLNENKTCTICRNEQGFFLNEELNKCQSCSEVIPYCVTCGLEHDQEVKPLIVCQECSVEMQAHSDGEGGCVRCANQQDIWLDLENAACQSNCSQVIDGCRVCAASAEGTVCAVCDYSFQYKKENDKQCVQCDNSQQLYLGLEQDCCCVCDVIYPLCEKCTGASSGTECVKCKASEQAFLNEEKVCEKCYNQGDEVRRWLNSDEDGCDVCGNVIAYCAQCVAGQVYATQCVLCLANHALTSSLTCQQCSSSQYLSEDKTSCVACSTINPQCVSCRDADTCLACGGKYALVGPTVCEACSEVQAVHSDGFRCVDCSTIDPFCYTCSDESTCTLCRYGMTPIENICKSIGCSTGVVVVSDEVAKCPGGCRQCSATLECQACKDGYYLTQGVCLPCGEECRVCSSTGCEKCHTGFYLCGDSCQQCADNCRSCNRTTCFECNTGYFPSEEGCEVCPEFCDECSAEACFKCESGYTIDENGQCVECLNGASECTIADLLTPISCSNGYLDEDENICRPCPIGCEDCSSDKKCSVCEFGYYLSQNDNLCYPVCESPCRTCLDGEPTQCTSCFTGYAHDDDNFKCLENLSCNENTCAFCPDKYFLEGGKCIECPTENCLSCYKQVCTQCKKGFFLNDHKECESCPSQCTDCQSRNNCQVCASGHYLERNRYRESTGRCLPCSTEDNCEECYEESNRCRKCVSRCSFWGMKCRTNKRISCKTTISNDLPEFKSSMNDFKSRFLGACSSKFRGRSKPFNMRRCSRGSTIIEGDISLDEDMDPEEIYEAMNQALREGKSLGQFRIEESTHERVGFEEPVEEEEPFPAYAIALLVVIPVLIIIGVIIIKCVGSKKEENPPPKENPEVIGSSEIIRSDILKSTDKM